MFHKFTDSNIPKCSYRLFSVLSSALTRQAIGFVLGILLTQTASASVGTMLPDFYASPGLSLDRESVATTVEENIDPFSGTLTLHHKDLVIPGNGGMDIVIQRVYNSGSIYHSRTNRVGSAGPNLRELLPRTPYGVGWNLHFGKVTRTPPQVLNKVACHSNTVTETTNVLDNPVFEAPDGTQHILVYNNSPSNGINANMVSRDHWAAYCLTNGAGGLEVISPDGMKYTLDYRKAVPTLYGTPATDYVWYTTKIEDRNGNSINIVYDQTHTTGNYPVFDKVTASNGRTVNFTYSDLTQANKIRLDRIIQAGGHSWKYNFTLLAGGHYLLNGVDRPVNGDWGYTYHNFSTGIAGDNALKTITYPEGGAITYQYDYECFSYLACVLGNTFKSLVVVSKTNGGRDIVPGTWTFSYDDSNTELITTTVTFPGGRYEYMHYGYRYSISHAGNPMLWRVGLLKEKRTYDGSTLLQTETYTYGSSVVISNENYTRPPYSGGLLAVFPNIQDASVIAPLLTTKVIRRDGTNYTTTYANFTANGDNINPHLITETGQATRTNNLDYFGRNDNQNIVHLVDDEAYGNTGNRKITRTFDTDANLRTEDRYGVKTTYTYTGVGDVKTKKNERNNTYTYSNYYRGIARTEIQPAGYSVTRGVRSDGSISFINDGRSNITNYGGDGLQRITSIDPPIGTTANIAWGNFTRSLTRGSHTQIITYDGFGRPSCQQTENIYIDIDYNVLGQKSFESYPSTSCNTTIGTTFAYDTLDRLKRITHEDNKFKALVYLSNNLVHETNERSKVIVYGYRSYGSPDEKHLIRITSPVGPTVIGKNLIGQMTSVSQGGATRTFSYSNTTNPFLYSESNPETGTTVYGRDIVGNMINRRVQNSAITTFVYDAHERLDYINYPAGMPDTDYVYDGNDNLERIDQIGGDSLKGFIYDENNNLKREHHDISGRGYLIHYSYDGLDFLETMTYPSGKVISFNPDDLGRPTKVGPYVNSISYHRNGVPSSVSHANGKTTTMSLDNRQRVFDLNVNGGVGGYTVQTRYGYQGNNNIAHIIDFRDRSQDMVFDYDSIDRLDAANGPWGTGNVIYTTKGDIAQKKLGTQNIVYVYSASGFGKLTGLGGSIGATFGYDVYGNVSSKTGGWIYDYDHAGNMEEVKKSGQVLRSYKYDGLNNRVLTTKNGETTVHIYTKAGILLADHLDSDGVAIREYAYLDDKLIATVKKDSGTNPLVITENVIGQSFGFGFGSNSHQVSVRLFSPQSEESAELCLTGYDINSATEASVRLNGVLLGYLPTGSPNALTSQKCFAIAEGQLNTAFNYFEIGQSTPGAIWGVRIDSYEISSSAGYMPAILQILD